MYSFSPFYTVSVTLNMEMILGLFSTYDVRIEQLMVKDGWQYTGIKINSNLCKC